MKKTKKEFRQKGRVNEVLAMVNDPELRVYWQELGKAIFKAENDLKGQGSIADELQEIDPENYVKWLEIKDSIANKYNLVDKNRNLIIKDFNAIILLNNIDNMNKKLPMDEQTALVKLATLPLQGQEKIIEAIKTLTEPNWKKE